jgi:hypothetical protein
MIPLANIVMTVDLLKRKKYDGKRKLDHKGLEFMFLKQEIFL